MAGEEEVDHLPDALACFRVAFYGSAAIVHQYIKYK